MFLDNQIHFHFQTTYAACFVLYHIARNKEVQEKLFKEAQTILPDFENDRVTSERLYDQATYTRAVLKESFRLNPVSVGVGRTTNTDLVLSGYQVPAGVLFAFVAFNVVTSFILNLFIFYFRQ